MSDEEEKREIYDLEDIDALAAGLVERMVALADRPLTAADVVVLRTAQGMLPKLIDTLTSNRPAGGTVLWRPIPSRHCATSGSPMMLGLDDAQRASIRMHIDTPEARA